MADMWIAHDHPEKPLAYGAWVCDCNPCALATIASSRLNPTLMFVVKRSMGRDLITAADLLTKGADSYATDPDDYVREVFVAR